MKIRFHGKAGELHSWALTTQHIAREFDKLGHEVFIKSTDGLECFPNDLKHLLLPGYHGYLIQGDTDFVDESGKKILVKKSSPIPEIEDKGRPYDLEMAYTIPLQGCRRFYPETKLRAIIWNYESSILPVGWEYYIRAIDYLLPSSQFSYDIFAQNGIPEEKMIVVPHGVDLSIFNPDIPPFELKTKKRVKFLHNAIPHHRKLHERVIKGYMETFNGDDDVCLVLKTKFIEPDKDKPFEVDVRKILMKYFEGKKNPPEVEVINDRFIENIGSLYTACDVVVSMSSTEGFCFLPGTEIDTDNGKVKIEEARPGMKVITHRGQTKKITKITHRDIDEEVVGIRRQGGSIIWGTKNHPFFAVKDSNISWIPLNDISKKDYVVVPKPIVEKNSLSYLNISDFIDSELEDNKVFYKTSPRKIYCNNRIELDSTIGKFFGLYIAEGCSDGRDYASVFASHKNENIAREIEKEGAVRFSSTYRERIYNNTGILSINGKVISKFLSNLFGASSHHKRIPRIFWGSNIIKDIIWGIFYGDGSLVGNSYIFSTASKQLADDLFRIFLLNNIFCYINHYDSGNYNQYSITIARQFNKRFEEWINPYKYDSPTKTNNNGFAPIIEKEDMFLVPVIDICKKHYKGRVYNLEVEDDHSYTVNGIAVHNCLPLLESLACDNLIIAPRHGGQLDFLNDDNSLLVDSGEMEAPASHQYWGYMKGAMVGDPDINHYKELLRHAYENLDKEKKRIRENAKKTAEKFSWDAAAKKILNLPIPEKSKRLHDRKKVIYLVPYDIVGGAEVWVKQAIKLLDRSTYEPHVAFISGSSDLFKKELEDLGATIEDLGNSGRDKALRCLLEAENYSIIHFHNSYGVYMVLQGLWKQGFRCRIVETVHSNLQWNDSMTKVSARGEHIVAISTVSNEMGREMLKKGNKNVVVLPQMIDWDKFNIERKKIFDGFTVGFVGRLSPEKNIPMILECAKQLPNANFVIVGDGPQRKPLEQVAGDNVKFLGNRNDVENLYASFDLLMLPSIMEGMPLVILEAMAAGTPILASDVGSIKEVVIDGINGILVWNPKNVGLFVRGIKKFMNQDFWNKCSTNCKAFSVAMKEKVETFNINHLYGMLFGR